MAGHGPGMTQQELKLEAPRRAWGGVWKMEGDGGEQDKQGSLVPRWLSTPGESHHLGPWRDCTTGAGTSVDKTQSAHGDPAGGNEFLLCPQASVANQRPLRPGLWLTTASLPESQ